MTRISKLFIATVLTALGASTGIAMAQTDHKSFESMALPDEDQIACKVPRPPRDLAETAYVRNGYRAILRIMAAEKWQETGSCKCFLTEITWEEVIDSGQKYITSSDPKRPFNTSELRLLADAKLAERDKACAN
ncbi:hypothetical protein AAFO92_14690 [Roseovarius sp. CAU 1744]|uniref:hypothetical protein n=1 Tax=Roseovarius sp. CAU 1744 TaxID=3140368 RepID=UPI00325B2BD0